MPQDQLFERHADAEPQGAAAETTDAAGRDLEHARSVRREPKLGVNGSFAQSERRAAVRNGSGDRVLQRRRMTRGRDVERLLEKRPVERIGLVEEREHVEMTAHQQALERDLGSGDELLDQHAAEIGIAALRHVRRSQQRADAGHGGAQFGGVVGADDAAASGKNERFDHAGKVVPVRHFREWDHRETRHRQARRAQPLAALRFAARRRHGLRRIVRQAQPFRGHRRHQRGQIVDSDHRHRPPRGDFPRQLVGGALRIAKAQRHRRLFPDVG